MVQGRYCSNPWFNWPTACRVSWRSLRSLGTVWVTCALLVGFVEAPFLHVHEAGRDEDHPAFEQVHVHTPLASSPVDGPIVQQLDPAEYDRTVNWFQTVQNADLFVYLAPEAVQIADPPAECECLGPPARVRITTLLRYRPYPTDHKRRLPVGAVAAAGHWCADSPLAAGGYPYISPY
jgi:hypothetical protein